MPADAIRIAHVYPELLGTYGDGGNATVLAQRARWRGIDVDAREIAPGSSVPLDADIYVLGGGEDIAQLVACRLLREDGGLMRAIDRGAVVLAVCAGLQILGGEFTVGGRVHAGLGPLDAVTTAHQQRTVGDVLAHASLAGVGALVGFENHQGRTTLGPAARPLATVTAGPRPGRGEGAVQGRIVATYLHGPVLALNPALADHLLGLVVGDLQPLDDELALRARSVRRELLA